MSLKRNILASYISQIYVTLIGIVMVPLYVKHMGVEAYGLIGFYAMLQAWFMLLDMGLTPTMARETARYKGGAIDAISLRRLLRVLEGIFISVALLGAIAIIAGAGSIASKWLKVQHLPLEEVQRAIMMMAIIIALRWICGLYRGVVNGFERMVWLSGYNISMATFRFVLVVPFLIYVGHSPTVFFSYQLAIALIEVTLLVTQTYRLLPRVAADQRTPWEWEPLRRVLKFSLSISLAVMMYLLGTQADKMVLSNLLTLTDYAYFTLAVLVASSVVIISSPISGALVPRLTKLNAEGNEVELIRLYRNSTQVVGVIAIPVMLVLVFFTEQVLWIWTGNAEIVSKAKPILVLYALANGIQIMGASTYYLQSAKGDLKLHMIGTGLYSILLIPAVIWGTLNYGAIGAGYACMALNAAYFIFWVPKIHGRFVKNLHAQWLLHDVMGIFMFSMIAAFVMKMFMVWPTTRLDMSIAIAMIGLLLCGVAATSSSYMRYLIIGKWNKRFAR